MSILYATSLETGGRELLFSSLILTIWYKTDDGIASIAKFPKTTNQVDEKLLFFKTVKSARVCLGNGIQGLT